MGIVFDKRIAQNLLSTFANAISSNTISKGTTFLKDCLDKKIFNDQINIIDKANIKKRMDQDILTVRVELKIYNLLKMEF